MKAVRLRDAGKLGHAANVIPVRAVDVGLLIDVASVIATAASNGFELGISCPVYPTSVPP
ncbi:MAG: hypothetical protein ACLPY1_24430 [Terracidiphilus sp.]